MRYRLRTLLIVLAILPPLLWGAWLGWREWQARRALRAAQQQQRAVKILDLGRDEALQIPEQVKAADDDQHK
jgi:hypothetical protein